MTTTRRFFQDASIQRERKGILYRLERQSRWLLFIMSLVFLAAVGIVDYVTGYELFFSVFYLVGVGLTAWFIGKWFGVLMSVMSVSVWIAGDVMSGARYSSPFIPIWNVLIVLVFYFIVVWLLASLRALQNDLENRVQQRTMALQQEIAERERLEIEILEIGERERRRISYELHDSLCQHLTGTALAGQVLTTKLASRSLPEAADAGRIVELVEDGIALARNLARGLYPVEMSAEGLMLALQELAANITSQFKISCQFKSRPSVLLDDPAAARHLYYITQEAVRNAIQHGKAARITISLSSMDDSRMKLTVHDDGMGLSQDFRKSQGLGIRIMAHRAAMIGGSFDIQPGLDGGTIVTCSFPMPKTALTKEDHADT